MDTEAEIRKNLAHLTGDALVKYIRDLQEEAYSVGYDEGHSDGYEEGERVYY